MLCIHISAFIRGSLGPLVCPQLLPTAAPFLREHTGNKKLSPSHTMASNTTTTTPYLDTAPLLTPDFSPSSHANALVLKTNNATDTPLDLSTPLQKILFDAQEVDTHIDTLTTTTALPLIAHTQAQNTSATHVLESVEDQLSQLTQSYERLSREVVERHAAAEQVRLAAQRMVQTLRLGRGVQRVVALGRQLEGDMSPSNSGDKLGKAAETILLLRQTFTTTKELERVNAANAVRTEIATPAERTLISRAQTGIRDFNPSGTTFAQGEEMKGRAMGSLRTLYLLSPCPNPSTFEPSLVVQALQSYLQSCLSASLAVLTRALATLPTLDRALSETSAKCQNILALETVLEGLRPPQHPLLEAEGEQSRHSNLLQPLLRALDESGSLASLFWRSLAGGLEGKVQEILQRGGVSARTLRSNRDRVRDAVRECVDRGYRGGRDSQKKTAASTMKWEREAAVMVGSVIGPLGR